MKEKLKEGKGITLIALIITIIILLILAIVTVRAVTENGIIAHAKNAKEITEDKNAEEKVKLAITRAKMGDGQTDVGKLTVKKLKKEIEECGGTLEGETFPVTVTVDGRTFIVEGTGEVATKTEKEIISKEQSYVGYYADIDADGTVDGVIYADLAVGGSGQFGTDSNGAYTIPKVTEGLKDYYISQTNYKANDGFGTKDVISPTGTGTERFYIMALEDFNNGKGYDWYHDAYMKISQIPTSEDFGKGKLNTTTMISKWNASEYGTQDDSDIWGQIQEEANNGWFVPSKEELAAFAAFAGELGISKDSSNEKYYGNFGLSGGYSSSSLRYAGVNWELEFYSLKLTEKMIFNGGPVRLSATF